jgi:beta-lactam-binding protein with PASTA domain
VLAILAVGASGYALWRTFDEDAAPRTQIQTTARTSRAPTTTVAVVTVPSQAGRNAMVATSELAKVGLKAKVSHKPSTTVPRERVVDQQPVEGTRVPVGTVIELFLSSGPP